MKSSFLPKYEPKIVWFLTCTVPHYRAEILIIFRSYFGRNDDFTKSFLNLLTFKVKLVERISKGIFFFKQQLLAVHRKKTR